MSLVVMDSGKEAFLNKLTANAGGKDLVNVSVHLYTNNHVPTDADLLANYTEAAWAGYVAQTITAWPAAALDGTDHAFSTAAFVSFLNTSGATVTFFGYYVTDAGATTLLFAEEFAGAPISLLTGSQAQVGITFTLDSEF